MLFGKKKRTITRLLIVEDEALVAFDTEHLLTEAKYEIVATVDRVADAVAVLADSRAVDLILVDVNLADGSGLDVARAARARDIPVLFVTGSFPPEATELAAGWLSKPFGQRDLLGAIAAVEAGLQGKSTRRMPSGFRLFATPA